MQTERLALLAVILWCVACTPSVEVTPLNSTIIEGQEIPVRIHAESQGTSSTFEGAELGIRLVVPQNQSFQFVQTMAEGDQDFIGTLPG